MRRFGALFFACHFNGTFNLPMANERFVIAKQDATASNNYTWYRLYNDGFVEQGGRTYKSGGGTVDVTLPVEMSHANYVVLRNQKGSSFQSYYPTWVAGLNPTQTQTGFNFYSASTTGYDYWKTSGMAATVPTYNKIQCIKYI